MRKIWKIVGIVALVAVLGVVAVGAVAFAQTAGEGSDGPFNFVERFRQNLAGILGISVEEYDNAVVQARDQTLDQALSEGWLTQDQADRMRERVSQAPGGMPWGMGRGFGKFGRGMGGWGVNLVSVAAEKLGMAEADLLTALRDGKSIADVANEKGVDPQGIADAYLAQLTDNLNQAVQDGQITQKQADYMLEQAQEQVLDQINGTWGDCGPGGFWGGRHGGHFPDFPAGDDS